MCIGCGYLGKNNLFLKLFAKQYNGKVKQDSKNPKKTPLVEVCHLAGLEEATLYYFQFSRSFYVFSLPFLKFFIGNLNIAAFSAFIKPKISQMC